MAWFKRIFLFMAVNILVMITITTLMSVLGVGPYLTEYGLNYESLAVFCLIWGFGGAFISLGLSRIMAKFAMGVKIVDPNTTDPQLRDLVVTVQNLSRAAGLPKTPQIGIYNNPEVNAFATGPTKSRSLVAVSSGLLQRMQKADVEGVLGHEIAHIANGDMVTMTLLQGVINAFVMFFARVIAFAVSQALRSDRDDRGSYMVQFAVTIVMEILLSLLGAIVVAAFSRHREFRADRGGAQYAGRQKMIGALEALRQTTQLIDTKHAQMATFKIAGKRGGLAALFSSHPPLEVRIQKLRESVG